MNITVSPSQINSAISCLRIWGFDKLDRLPKQDTRQTLIGTKTHEILENWLKKGIPPDTELKLKVDGVEYHPGRSALNGLHHLPPPGPHLAIESEFYFKHWYGRVDMGWVALDGQYVPRDLIPQVIDSEHVIPGIGDHKTSGSKTFEYALTEETLRTDPQGIIYANVMFDEFPRAKFVDELWVYYGTRPPHPSKKVHIRIERAEAQARLEPIDVLAASLIRLRGSSLRAMNLPPNPTACDKYGGCPHRARCNLSPSDQMKGFMMNNLNNIDHMPLDQKIAMAAQQANAALMTTVPAPILETPPPPTPSVGQWVDHPQNAAYEWNTGTGEYRLKAQPVAAPVIATPAIMAPPVATNYLSPGPTTATPITQPLPPIVMMPSAPTVPSAPSAPSAPSVPAIPAAPAAPAIPPPLVVGPDGLPPGSINAPEGANVPDRAQPVVAAPAAADDLEAMGKEQLVDLAKRMGLDTTRKREAGIRDLIRSARIRGVQPAAAAPAQTSFASAQTSFAAVGDAANGAGPVVNTAQFSAGPETFERTRTDRAHEILVAMIRSGSFQNFTIDQLVAWAKEVATKTE